MFKNGVIEKSRSPYTANVVVIEKKDGEGEGMDRLCVNFGPLNRKTIVDRYPLPIIMELLRLFWGCEYYTVIDLKAAYWQVPVREQDREKTAFRTASGHYQFRVMPFGLNNAPATFQRLMNDVLRDYLRKFVAVYLDDIIIFSKDKKSHKRHVKKVLNKIRGANLKIKITKCQWFLNEIKFVGHKVNRQGIQPDEEFIDYPIEIKDYNHVYRRWNYPCELCNQEDHHSHIVKNKPKKQLRSWDIVAKSYINARQAVEAEPAIYCLNCQEYDETQARRQAESSSMGAGWVNSNY